MTNQPPAGKPPTNGALLEARGIHKSFGRVRALRGADFDVRRGEVVALVGDNGAGKSTLIKVLSGIHAADAGEIRFEDEPVSVPSPEAARAARPCWRSSAPCSDRSSDHRCRRPAPAARRC